MKNDIRNINFFLGFQAEGFRGRKLLECGNPEAYGIQTINNTIQ
jgi:hypothetical protein